MTDGTDAITWLDPVNFKTVRQLKVQDKMGPVDMLNELEFINGQIYANVYGTDYIVRIDPATGDVTGKIDLSSVASEARSLHAGSLEMNGIAYDSVARKV